MNTLLWQLADSAFPCGGFVHSNGLEAAYQQGEISGEEELAAFLRASLHQAGRGLLPLVSAAHDDPARIEALDGLCDACLSNHVANRASRAQGRAFLNVCERAFPHPPVLALGRRVRSLARHRHHAPLFGALTNALEVKKEAAQELFLFLVMRGVLSAAVRLGLTGTLRAQYLQRGFAGELQRVLGLCAALDVDELAQTAPLNDLFQANHDRQYARLFQS